MKIRFRSLAISFCAGLMAALALSADPASAAGRLLAAPPSPASGPANPSNPGSPAAVASALAAVPAGNDDSWVRVAVVAASAKGMEGDRPLQYAYRDGERLQTMLASVGQVEPANLFLLKAENRAEFQASLARIGGRIAQLKGGNRKVFLQFYYSGHGGAKRFHFPDGTLSFDEVKAALGGDRPERLRADARVYVLDVCFGASFFNAKGFRTAPPVQLQMEMDQAARGEVTISSSSVDEQAYEVKTLGGSIFTSHWIMALRGAGDRNRDGQVTLFEAYNYAYDRTSGYSAETLDRPQHPSFQMDLTGARDVTLARLLHSTTGILFKGCPAGLYNVVDLQRGIQIGELRIPEGEEFTLALEPGRYRVVYLPGKPGRTPAQAADLELASASMATLPFAAFRTQPADAGLAKGSFADAPGETAPAAEAMEGEGGGSAAATGSATDGTAEEAPPRRQRRRSDGRVGFWARTGLSAWAGAAGFEDARLERNMNAVPEVDRYFGTEGRFRKPALKSDLGFDVNYAVTGPWFAGLRLGLSYLDYSYDRMGREPLNSLPDSSRGRYPVSLRRSYAFQDVRFGPFFGRTFQVTHSQGFAAESGISLQSRSITGEHVLERPLYGTTEKASSDLGGQGLRLEAGLEYRALLPSRLFGKGLVLGLRLSPYYARVDDLREGQGNLDLSASEAGCAATFIVSLMGRNTPIPPAPSPRSAL